MRSRAHITPLLVHHGTGCALLATLPFTQLPPGSPVDAGRCAAAAGWQRLGGAAALPRGVSPGVTWYCLRLALQRMPRALVLAPPAVAPRRRLLLLCGGLVNHGAPPPPLPPPLALRLWTRVLLLQQLLVELMDLLDPDWRVWVGVGGWCGWVGVGWGYTCVVLLYIFFNVAAASAGEGGLAECGCKSKGRCWACCVNIAPPAPAPPPPAACACRCPAALG